MELCLRVWEHCLYYKAKYQCALFIAIIDGIVSAQNTHLVGSESKSMNVNISLDGYGIIRLSCENCSATDNVYFNSEVFKGQKWSLIGIPPRNKSIYNVLLENNFKTQILSGRLYIIALKTKEFGEEGRVQTTRRKDNGKANRGRRHKIILVSVPLINKTFIKI